VGIGSHYEVAHGGRDRTVSTGCLPRYTGGQVYHYPGFNATRTEDVIKFGTEFATVLASPICLEAVIRVRASRGEWPCSAVMCRLNHANRSHVFQGLRLSAFHGNFFTRSTDLLSLPTVPMDQSYAIELQLEDPLTTPYVVLQTGILHTTAFG
jgi:protein transport protein SEC24